MDKTCAVYPWKFRRRGWRSFFLADGEGGGGGLMEMARPCALKSGGPGEQARSPSADEVLSPSEVVREGWMGACE